MNPTSYLYKMLVEATREHIPLDVAIELTHHCNFRCQHCYIPDFSAPDLVGTDRMLHLLEELAEMGTLYLTLTGGELFLRKDWYVIASRARELGFGLRLFSNGALVDEDVADKVASLHATAEISLYSMKEEIFERITQKKGSFQRTIRGIELLRARDVEVLLKIAMMIHNTKCYEDVFRYAESVGAECRADDRIVPKKNGDLVTLELRPDPEEIMPLYRHGFTPCAIADGNGGRGDGPLCAAGTRYANISSAGDVKACNILPGVAGNIREHSFREIWEGSAWLQKVRGVRLKDIETCSTCDKLSYCGRCHALAMMEDGNMLGPSSTACAHAEMVERVHAERETETTSV